MMWLDGMGWAWFFNWIVMIIFWGGIVALIIWGITKITKGNNGTANKNNALDIAKERYAKGEISKEEFDQLKKDIEK